MLEMTRRRMLKVLASGAGLMLLGAGQLVAGGAKKKNKPGRPPRTCGGYRDAKGDGVCDRSVGGPKRCKASKCPGHGGNPAFKALAKSAAPAGVCALYSDPETQGYCVVCDDAEAPCLHPKCPTHKENPKRLKEEGKDKK